MAVKWEMAAAAAAAAAAVEEDDDDDDEEEPLPFAGGPYFISTTCASHQQPLLSLTSINAPNVEGSNGSAPSAPSPSSSSSEEVEEFLPPPRFLDDASFPLLLLATAAGRGEGRRCEGSGFP
jgi:hypothetical protein